MQIWRTVTLSKNVNNAQRIQTTTFPNKLVILSMIKIKHFLDKSWIGRFYFQFGVKIAGAVATRDFIKRKKVNYYSLVIIGYPI